MAKGNDLDNIAYIGFGAVIPKGMFATGNGDLGGMGNGKETILAVNCLAKPSRMISEGTLNYRDQWPNLDAIYLLQYTDSK